MYDSTLRDISDFLWPIDNSSAWTPIQHQQTTHGKQFFTGYYSLILFCRIRSRHHFEVTRTQGER